MRKKSLFIALASLGFLFFSAFFASAETTCSIPLTVQVPFGAIGQNLTINSSTLGSYIQAIYIFGTAILITVAIILVMVSGIQWIMSAGEASKISAAKDRIIKAIIGLVIGLFAIFILRLVNPQTTIFEPLNTNCIPTGSALENMPCASSDNCGFGLFCAKATQKCTRKYPSINTEQGQCAGAEISGKNDLACQSNDCQIIATPSCDSGYCCGSGGTLQLGTTCTAQNCANGLFCNAIRKVCETKNTINAYCNSSAVMGGNADLMCDTNSCSSTLNVCVYLNGTYQGQVGDSCTDNSQCKTNTCDNGKCALLANGQQCNPSFDQCESGNCADCGQGGICYCRPQS
ncbi:MAG: pilin [Patescibacteria group bacterium]|nr:pilin [Patescibacteria group bacterium]